MEYRIKSTDGITQSSYFNIDTARWVDKQTATLFTEAGYSIAEALVSSLQVQFKDFPVAISIESTQPTQTPPTETNVTVHNRRESDKIRPAHYGGDANPFEPIKIIEHYDLNFNIGNVIKYTLRAGRKSSETILIDLQKAKQYLEFELKRHKL